jgi:cytochrome c-type biogenesis protein CcmH/NrfG
MGNNALSLDQFNKALVNYTNELKEHPRSEVYEKIAITHANLYESEETMENVLEALKLDSLYAPAYVLLGRIYRDEGKIEDALKNLRKAHKLDPENYEYVYELGALLFRSGSIEESINYLSSARQNMQWHYGSHYNLGQALVQMGRDREGRQFLVRADSLQELESLTARFLQRTRERPENQADWGNLANIFRRMGKLSEATKAYKIALSLGPNDIELRNTVAYLSLVTGDTTGAVWHYRRLLEEDNTKVDTWFNLGIIQVSRGEFGAARRSWENVLRLAPEDSTTSQFLRKLPKSTFLEILE